MSTLGFVLRFETGGAGAKAFVAAAVVGGVEFAAANAVPPYTALLLSELRDPRGRLHVRMCGCGVPGCWSLTARISRTGDEVVWDGWCEGTMDEDGWPGVEISLPALRFDAAVYGAAVDRLTTPWESRS